MNWLQKLFSRTAAIVDPEPDPFAEEDMTNRGITMDWLVAALGENKAVPRQGDAIIEITTDGMGMGVARDDRWRVTGPGRQNGSSVSVPVRHAVTGRESTLSVFYMRPHTKLARTWWLQN